MRYAINFDRILNQLVPYYLGGRRLILYLQSCMKPLQAVNDEFVDWAKETRIEAAMTSQIFKFEWFLNRKFSQYFANRSERIVIKNGEKIGTPVFYQSASDIDDSEQFRVYHQNEPNAQPSVLHYDTELTDAASHSFVVYCPALWRNTTTNRLRNNITEQEFLSMLTYWIERYKLAGKTYKIIINEGI